MKRSILAVLVLAVPLSGNAQASLDGNPWLDPSLRHFATRLDSGNTGNVGPGLVEIRAGGSAACLTFVSNETSNTLHFMVQPSGSAEFISVQQVTENAWDLYQNNAQLETEFFEGLAEPNLPRSRTLRMGKVAWGGTLSGKPISPAWCFPSGMSLYFVGSSKDDRVNVTVQGFEIP